MRRTDRGVVLGLYRHDPDRHLLEHALKLGICGVDTAYNYRGFTSHRMLAQSAGDLLAEFTVSTKVGFFPGPDGHTVHSLEPERLRIAVEQSSEDLGRTPDVVFLHNPERTLAHLSTDEGADRLAGACAYLAEAVSTGFCAAWGISSWDPRPLVNVLAASKPDRLPTVLLVRAGLTVPDSVLAAAEQIGEAFGIAAAGRWGMSPFGGGTAETVWRTTNLSAFLAPQQRCSTPQAAFRLAFELPSVTRIAVGTGDTAHLTELVAATDADVAADAINQYRELIRADT
ncbi:aldo/keto reductase [Nocardia nepalensis]|uniref:aldo/keto reductase n=1 Tax=Nocardia nepalensis TaxID=3375448 RepID=UPI003B67C427